MSNAKVVRYCNNQVDAPEGLDWLLTVTLRVPEMMPVAFVLMNGSPEIVAIACESEEQAQRIADEGSPLLYDGKPIRDHPRFVRYQITHNNQSARHDRASTRAVSGESR